MKKDSNDYPLFQHFGNDVRNIYPKAEINIHQLVETIKNPDLDMINIYQQIMKAPAGKERSELKGKIPFCIPAVLLDGTGRSYGDIVNFTGIMVLDFDKFDNVFDARIFKMKLFKEHDSIIASWLSVSGIGVRALVRIPVVKNVEEYKSYFWGFIITNKLSDIDEFDSAPQNPVLPMFMSMDKEIHYRTDPTVWLVPGSKPTSHRPIAEYVPADKPSDSSRYYQWSVSNVEQAIGKITNSGHPQVVAAARTLGGRVGAGYISLDDAEAVLIRLIRANAYLSKGTDGYLKTASTMLNYGTNEPLYF